MTTPTTITTFEDILAAMEQNPQLQAAMRAHILGQELLALPARFVELQEQVNHLQQTVDDLTGRVDKMSGTVSRLAGEDYESHVCNYAERLLRRQLGINATVWATQRNKDPLTAVLNAAEIQRRLSATEVDDLDKTDLILESHAPDAHVVVEISITIQQNDVDRAISRAALLAKATGRDAIAIVAGTAEEAGLDRRNAQTLIVAEPPGPNPS